MELLKSVPMGDMPFFISNLLKVQADDTIWEIWLHKVQDGTSFADFKKDADRNAETIANANLPKDVKKELEKEAIDFSSQFIQFE